MNASRATLVEMVPASSRSPTVICILHAAAGIAALHAWRPTFEACGTGLVGVRLPGRESRIGEPPYTECDAVVELIASEMALRPEARVTIFGMCSGALIGYRLCQAIAFEHDCPRALLVASQLPPHHFARGPGWDSDRATALALLTMGMAATPELAEDEDFIELMLPALLADLQVMASLSGTDPGRLKIPIVAFRGNKDEMVSDADTRAWMEYTTNLTVESLEGGHLMRECWATLGGRVAHHAQRLTRDDA